MFRSLVSFIPNLLTLLNLSFGLIGIVLAMQEQLHWAGVMILFASVFDFFDGFAARLLNAQSDIGKELDSLADLVAFGALPALLIYQFLNGLLGIYFLPFLDKPILLHLISMAGFLLAACGALRLAKFNVDTRQSSGFLGVPIPASAIFFASIPIIAHWQYEYNLFTKLDARQIQGVVSMYHYNDFDRAMIELLQSWKFIVGCVLLFSYLMVSEIPILALKFKSLNWKDNKWRFIFLISAGMTILICFSASLFGLSWMPWLQFWFIPLVILELVLVSVIRNRLDPGAN